MRLLPLPALPRQAATVSRSRLALYIFVLAALLALGTAGCTDRNSPEYAAEQIVNALRDRDRLRLEAFLDPERLAESVVEEANEAMAVQARQKPEVSERELFMGLGLGRSGQVEMARAAIRTAVGELTDPAREWTDAERDALTQLQVRHVRRAAHMAEAEVIVRRPGGEAPVRLTARLERSGGAWRLVGLSGSAAWMGAFGSTAAEKR